MSGLYTGPIVDAHHHAWEFSAETIPWLAAPGLESLRRTVGPDAYRAAAAGLDVVGTVWIEALAADPLAEARTAQAWADADRRFCSAIVAHVPLDAPDVDKRLDALQQEVPNLRGIRDIVAARPGQTSLARRPDLLASPAFERGLRLLAERGLVFDLMLEAPQLADAAGLMAALSGLSVVIEHAGSPNLHDAADRADWIAGLRSMADLPNAAVKISALHCRLPGWTDAALCEPIDTVIDLFGADRVAFASDFPVHDRTCHLSRAYQTFRHAVRDRSEHDQHALFCGTARRLYRL